MRCTRRRACICIYIYIVEDMFYSLYNDALSRSRALYIPYTTSPLFSETSRTKHITYKTITNGRGKNVQKHRRLPRRPVYGCRVSVGTMCRRRWRARKIIDDSRRRILPARARLGTAYTHVTHINAQTARDVFDRRALYYGRFTTIMINTRHARLKTR